VVAIAHDGAWWLLSIRQVASLTLGRACWAFPKIWHISSSAQESPGRPMEDMSSEPRWSIQEQSTASTYASSGTDS